MDSKPNAFVAFMAGSIGRGVRVLAGVVLIVLALAALSGIAAWIVALIGLVAIAAGAFNVCLIAPLLHAPLHGRDVRS